MPETAIRSVLTNEILEIRHQVLWPEKPLEFVKVPDDENAFHFAMFVDDQLMSVISLFPDGENMRFRKFATIPEFQNKGLGSQLLKFAINYSQENHYKNIWCDARSNALGFYEKFGFSKFSQPFFKEEIEYYKISKML